MAIRLEKNIQRLAREAEWWDKKAQERVIEELRHFMDSNCGADPLEIRKGTEDFPPTCRALANLEYQLVRLHDGNFNEVSQALEREKEKTVGEYYQDWREAYKRAYGKYPVGGKD